MVQVYYLDEFVDVTTHNLVGWHARKNLEVFSGEGTCALVIARPTLSQILDDLESTYFFPLLVKCSFFIQRVISSTAGGNMLVLFRPHLDVYFLVKLSCHLCKRKTLKKGKEKERVKRIQDSNESNEHLLFSSIFMARRT